MRVIGFLEEVMHDPELLTQERKAAANIIRLVFRYHRLIAHTVIYGTSVCNHPVEKSFYKSCGNKNRNWRYNTSAQVLA